MIPGSYHHVGLVVKRRRLRDGFRKTYWSRCLQCGWKKGPYNHMDNAWVRADLHTTKPLNNY